MANEWIHVSGPKIIVKAPSDTTITRGSPCTVSSNKIIAAVDGGTVDLVCNKDCVSGDTAVPCILPMGDVFRVKALTAINFGIFDKAYLSDTFLIDTGAVNQTSQMRIVNYNPGSGCCAEIAVMSALLHPFTYGAT